MYISHSLYAALRLAVGWMLWNIRTVDDGMLRRRMCEGLLVCHGLQSLIVLRAQLTSTNDTANVNNNDNESHYYYYYYYYGNWLIWIFLTGMAMLYGRFRFGRGGNLIKIYELPTAATFQ
jgi:hypothetical protein